MNLIKTNKSPLGQYKRRPGKPVPDVQKRHGKCDVSLSQDVDQRNVPFEICPDNITEPDHYIFRTLVPTPHK